MKPHPNSGFQDQKEIFFTEIFLLDQTLFLSLRTLMKDHQAPREASKPPERTRKSSY
jgi:hypothetical protein